MSYTVDTLRQFCKDYPNDELFLLMCTDMFCSFSTWREPHEIAKLATVVCMMRTKTNPKLSEQLEQSHQAIATLWEEKAELQKQVDETTERIAQLHAVGVDFCRQVSELLPEQPEEAAAPAEEPLPLVVDMPSAEANKPMERWLF
jgi:nicotinate-nucleotide adenylyltransferase